MGVVRYSSLNVVLEPPTGRLWVGDRELLPQPKVLGVLAHLMHNADRIVSKAELLDSLWPGETVGESSLSRCVSCLRKLLNDDARAPTFIQTAHGRGYRFVPTVSKQLAVDDSVEQRLPSHPTSSWPPPPLCAAACKPLLFPASAWPRTDTSRSPDQNGHEMIESR